MNHPILESDQKTLRGRVVQLLKSGYNVNRAGNILFVCGGNDDVHMRQRFKTFCTENAPEYDIFFPEFAMDDYFSGDVKEPFNIATFEEIIGQISHAIVIFPEGPGSFAETGYFSAKTNLAEKSILILDSRLQAQDSFISMGPATIIGSDSRYNPVIQMDYDNPDFAAVVARVQRHKVGKYRKLVKFSDFSQMSEYDLMGLIQKICDILSIALIDDIEFILRAMFSSQISTPRFRKIASILVGSQYLCRIGEYGHLHCNLDKDKFFRLRDGYAEEERSIRLKLAELYETGDQEFANIVEASRNVD